MFHCMCCMIFHRNIWINRNENWKHNKIIKIRHSIKISPMILHINIENTTDRHVDLHELMYHFTGSLAHRNVRHAVGQTRSNRIPFWISHPQAQFRNSTVILILTSAETAGQNSIRNWNTIVLSCIICGIGLLMGGSIRKIGFPWRSFCIENEIKMFAQPHGVRDNLHLKVSMFYKSFNYRHFGKLYFRRLYRVLYSKIYLFFSIFLKYVKYGTKVFLMMSKSFQI